MLLEPLVLQHFQKQCCWNHWFYNISKNNVAKTIGFTIVSNRHMLLTFLTVDISKNNVAETNGFSNIVFVNVVEPLVLATFASEMLWHQWFLTLFEGGNDDEDDGH